MRKPRKKGRAFHIEETIDTKVWGWEECGGLKASETGVERGREVLWGMRWERSAEAE